MGYALLSGMGRPQLRSQLYGGTKDGLSLADVKDVTLYVPPLDEQKRIVEHIDAQTADIDAAIERTERQLALMQQYRTSLVTEVVTGAVDVRDEVAA
jgi:type I restriction enzyme S subunit